MIDDHESSGNGDPNNQHRYYSGSPDSISQQFNTYQPILLSCSEASASPTPSHSSEGSLSTSTYNSAVLYTHQDNYENYDPKSPEDEELLDAIFSWQQE